MNFSEEMQNVFDQDTGLGRDGIVRGGTGKLIFLGGYYFDSTTLGYLLRTPCRAIVEQFRSLFRDFYLHVPTKFDIDPELQSEVEAKRGDDPRVKESREKLHSSEWVLALMNEHLASAWDVDNDGSLYTAEFRLDPSGSKIRRKRKAPDDVDEKGTYNSMIKGRLPPKMSVPPVHSLSSQGHRHFLSGTLSTPPSTAPQPSDGSLAQAPGSSRFRSGGAC